MAIRPTPSAAGGTGVAPILPAPGPISAVRVWLLAIRPATLPAAASGVVVGLGAAQATGGLRLDVTIACLAVALLLQIAANLANDLSDFRRGADTPDRLGPTRVAAAGLATPRQLMVAIGLVIGAAGIAGAWLATVGGLVVLLLGAAAIVAALAYTGGPWPYGYRGLGEAFVFLFFGLMGVAGTAYLETGRLEGLDLVAAIPIGTLVTAILVVNNLRDVASDEAAGKRTLAVIFGRSFARAEYLLCLAIAYAVPVIVLASRWSALDTSVGGSRVGPLVLLPLASVVLAAPLWGAVRSEGDPRGLNLVLKGTARLALAFGVLFGAGLAAGRWPW